MESQAGAARPHAPASAANVRRRRPARSHRDPAGRAWLRGWEVRQRPARPARPAVLAAVPSGPDGRL